MKIDAEVTDPNKAYEWVNFNVKYNIRKMILPRTNKDGQTKIYIEVCQYLYTGTGQYETKFKRISTDVWVNPKDWNKKKELLNGKDQQAETKNKDIDRVYIAVKEFVNSKGQQTPEQAYSERMSLQSLREFFPDRTENRKALVDYFDMYITQRKAQGTIPNTLKEFTTVRNRVRDFDTYRGKKSYLDNLTLMWSDEFNLFLLQRYSSGTIEKTYVVLSTVLNYYYDRRDEMQLQILDKYKLKAFKHGRKSINEPNPLTREQLETLYLHKFTEQHLQRTRDRFLWQAYTGIRFIDAFTITSKYIKNGWLNFRPSKTRNHNVEVLQPLNPVALELLKAYEYDMTKLAITNQAYNRDLKQMFNKLNETYKDQKNFRPYDPEFGSYSSRDSFISLCVEAGVNWHDILKYVGQSSFSIMNRYVRTSDKSKADKINTVFAIPQKVKE